MQPRSGAPGPAAAPEEGAVAIVAALSSEKRALRRGAGRAGWVVVQSGPGAVAAAAAASAAVDAGATAIVSWGLAGGLVPDAQTGTIVLPHRVVCAGRKPVDVASRWRERVAVSLGRTAAVIGGVLAAVDVPVTDPDAKRRLGAELEAVAVDMESHAIGSVAAASGIPFLAIRVVVDAHDDALPAAIGGFVTPRGNVHLLRVVVAALGSGRTRKSIRALGRRSAVAHAVLRRAAAELAADGLAPGARAGQVSA